MADLTQEQVERAAKAAHDAFMEDGQPIGYDKLAQTLREPYRSCVRAAAPFLQLPWDEPTLEEASKANQCMDGQSAIFDFIRRRNAALLPKPVDPRLAVVRHQLGGPSMSHNLDGVAVKILHALDQLNKHL